MFGRHTARAMTLVVNQLRSMTQRLDPAALTGPQAVRLLEWFTVVERLAAAGKALVADRAAETNQWRQDGDRSPEHWLARKSGSTVGSAKDALDTVRRMKKLPHTEAAMRRGRCRRRRRRWWPTPPRPIPMPSRACSTLRRGRAWPSSAAGPNG